MSGGCPPIVFCNGLRYSSEQTGSVAYGGQLNLAFGTILACVKSDGFYGRESMHIVVGGCWQPNGYVCAQRRMKLCEDMVHGDTTPSICSVLLF